MVNVSSGRISRMNIFQLSISTFVFGVTLLVGTTAVIAARYVITTVASLTKASPVPESVVISAAEPERGVDLPDLRNARPHASEDFDPSGPYVLDPEKVPAAFADIEWIDIVTHRYVEDDETYINQPIIPNGSLEAKKEFTFTKIAVGNREIAFETASVGGISYQFVGNFPISTEAIKCEECEYPADLKGKLKKLKNGKVIAELDAKFYVGGC
jgi:hypothetical protein